MNTQTVLQRYFGDRTQPFSLLLKDKMEPEIAAALRTHLQKIFHTLKPAPAKVLSLRWGLADGIYRTKGQTAKLLGMAREHVRQIEIKALRKMVF